MIAYHSLSVSTTSILLTCQDSFHLSYHPHTSRFTVLSSVFVVHFSWCDHSNRLENNVSITWYIQITHNICASWTLKYLPHSLLHISPYSSLDPATRSITVPSFLQCHLLQLFSQFRICDQFIFNPRSITVPYIHPLPPTVPLLEHYATRNIKVPPLPSNHKLHLYNDLFHFRKANCYYFIC